MCDLLQDMFLVTPSARGVKGMMCSSADEEVSLLEAACGASCLPHPCQTSLCKLSFNAVCCWEGSPNTSNLSGGLREGVMPL